jgi:hypothetical protein
MMSFNQIGKSSILFSSEAPIVALHSIVAVFSGHPVFLALAGYTVSRMAAIDLNKENGVSFIEGARSRSGRRFIGGAIRSAG